MLVLVGAMMMSEAGHVDWTRMTVALPAFLTSDAVSPAFAAALDESGASLASPLTTAGLDTDDVAALAPGSEGAAVSAYLAGLRATAEDGEVTDFFDNEKFETVAGAADARSHDAVVALVTAVADATSADPKAVRDWRRRHIRPSASSAAPMVRIQWWIRPGPRRPCAISKPLPSPSSRFSAGTRTSLMLISMWPCGASS